MIRRLLFLGAFCLALFPRFARSDSIQLIQGAPSLYTPGQPAAFDVRLPAVANLGAYNIDLVLESSTGTAGADFFFDAAATAPMLANYVFPSAANYFGAANVDSASRHRITLSDFDFTGVDVVPGLNDLVARVVFRTAETFSGHLSLFVDAEGLILDTPDVEPTPIIGFDGIKADVAASSPITIGPVPEPSSLILAMLALAAGCRLRRTSR